MDKLISNGSDLSSAEKADGISDNVVRIMSIHSSKGLEFPICIIANLSRRFNSETKSNMLIHPNMGIGFMQNTEVRGCKYNTMMRKAVSKCIAMDEKSEARLSNTHLRFVMYAKSTERNHESPSETR